MAKRKVSSNSATSQFSFMNRERAANYVKIQEAQFQEYCNLYGITVDYFSRNLDYYDRNGNIRNLYKDGKFNSDIKDFTYFAGPERYNFGVMMPIKFLVDYGTDNFMFAGFGMDTTNDAKIYITKKQFTNNCLQFFGLPKNKTITSTFKFNVLKWNILDVGEVLVPLQVEDGLVYNMKVKLDKFDEIELDTAFTTDIVTGFEFPVSGTVNPEYTSVVDNNKFIEFDEDSFKAVIIESKVSEKTGKGYVVVEFTCNISYNTFQTNYDAHWDTLDAVLDEETGKTVPITFAPKVGDIVRVRMIDDPNVFRDYTITFVNDTNLSKDGISPLMTNYCWECSITRRKPSHEDLEVEDETGKKVDQFENGLESVVQREEQEKVQDLNREKDVFDYDEQFADVQGMLVDNIDAFKDGAFGSYNWVENDDKTK